MKLSPVEKWTQRALQVHNSEQCALNIQKQHQASLSAEYRVELTECVQHVINEAEKNCDVNKKNQFLALRAEL